VRLRSCRHWVFGGFAIPLTVGEDSGAKFTGTSGNDIFNAVVVQDNNAVPKNTLENFDVLDGGEGTDTLNATLGTATTVAPTLKNIEILNIRTTDAVGKLDLTSASGVQQLWSVGSTAAAEFDNVGSVAALGVKNQNTAVTFNGNKATAQTFVFDTVGKSTKSADEVVVKAATGATSATFAVTNANVDLQTVATIKTVTVNASGANRLELSATAAAVETVTVTGSGSVDLDDVTLSALKTFDASTNTGGVTVKVDATAVTVTGGSGDDEVTYTEAIAATAKVSLGDGDDTLTIAAASAKGAVVNGGAGSNTLAVNDGAFLNADSKTIYTGFQTLEIGDGEGVYNLDNLTTITAVKLSEVALSDVASITIDPAS
jgi:hypothetical protein